MKLLSNFLFLLLLAFNSLNCQTQTEQDLINEQVWIPFMKSYSDFEMETFIALHADEMIRVTQDNGKIRTKKEYAESIREWWPKSIAKGKKRILELRFAQRINNENAAFETGIYKSTYPKPDGTSESHYGLFQVTLKKVNGIWKITMDSDSNHGKTIGEEDFLEGVSIN